MNDTRLPKLGYKYILIDIRNPGRPKKRWKRHKNEYQRSLEKLCILLVILQGHWTVTVPLKLRWT